MRLGTLGWQKENLIMVKSCCVVGCTNRATKGCKVSFFKFPVSKTKRRAWVNAVNRKGWLPNKNSRICSEHFETGWHSDDRDDPNYRPTLFSYKCTPEENSERFSRAYRRNLTKTFEEAAVKQENLERCRLEASVRMHSYSFPEELQTSPGKLYNVNVYPDEDDIDIGVVITADEGSQCDPDPLLEENTLLKEENMLLKEKLHKLQWGVNKIKDDDVATRFYSGLPSFAVFLWLYNFLLPKARCMTYWVGEGTSETGRQRPNRSTLPLIDQLLAVLMRLKVGLLVTDIAERFGISPSRFSSIFTTWICLLHAELCALNKFPSREKIASCLPECLKKFPNLRVIFDCTEIYIQKSSSLVNQNLTFSNYKHHTTMKFLIGISPAGVISFVSNAWGGKTSDRQMVIDSGFLDLLEPGDNVMADKGFTIRDLLHERGCTLNIPPFNTKGQFSVDEILYTQEIAKVRIHVERSIGRIKCFHIFDGVMPLSLAPLLNQMFQVASFLTNLDVPLIEN